MALFKIYKGQKSNLGKEGNVTRKAQEGFAYFTPDDGKFYIDIATADVATIGVNRIPLNANKADYVSNNLTLKIKSGTTENTNQYIFNGSSAKTLDIKQGTGITLTAATNSLTIENALATSSARGGIKIGYTQSGKNYPVQLSSEKAYVNVPWTDTQVTSVGNHYAPTADTTAALSASATGASAAWSIDVVKGVQLSRDAKGHVTGITVTSGKIPANPNTDYRVRQVNDTSDTNYRILLSYASNDDQVDNISHKSGNLIYNPSNNLLSTGNLNLTGELNVVGNATFNNETYADSLTVGSLLVNGQTNFIQIPTAPTATAGTNNTQLATTEFVNTKASNYLPLSGGQMVGPLAWKNETALPQKNSADYFLTIDSFASGGKTYWISKANVISSLDSNHKWVRVTGDTMTDSLTISKAGECGIEVVNSQSTNPHSGLFGVGSSGNLGIYDRTKGKWVVYSDPSGNVVLNGNANTASSTPKTGTTAIWLYPENNNEINFGGTNTGTAIYIGYRGKDSRSIPTKFIFGSSSGTADLQAKTVYLGSGTSSYVSSSNYTGNAATATQFASAQSITLSGDVSGSASSQAGWSLTTSIGTGKVTNAMLAGAIANSKLSNSTITINNHTISLGGSAIIEPSDLGLSNAMHFIGVATVAIADGSSTDPAIDGYNFTEDRKPGDVILDSSSNYEYVWTIAGTWEALGPEGSYKVRQTVISKPSETTNQWVSAIGQNANGDIDVSYATLNTSGTWSGNAATASKLGTSTVGATDRPIYLSSGTATATTYRMASTNAVATTARAITNNLETGIWYVSGTNSSDLYSQSDGVVYVEKYSDSWIHEIYGDYRTGQIAVRGKNNGTWQAWRKILDSSNYTDYTVTKTGTGASGTWGIDISGNAATATSVAWSGITGKPSTYPPSSHTHGNITNDGKIGSTADYAVYTTTDGTLTAGSLTTPDPTADGNATSFIATISQDSKGKISATKKSLSISSGTSALAWNSEVTLATVGGTAIKAKLPANPNTNTTYTFADGTNGSFSVTPGGGSAQTVSIGKPATAGTADVANSVAWANITGKPSSYTPSSHTHFELATQGDNRTVATVPNDYKNRFIFRGLKTNSSFGSPSSDTYSYVLGLRGWSDSSGGYAHELAFNNTGIFWRKGATDSWGNWYRVYTTENKPTNLDVGLGNVTNDAQIPKSIGSAKGDIIYWSAASTLARLGIGSAGQVLKVSSDGVPVWSSDNNSLNWGQITQSGANDIEEGSSDFTDNTEIFSSYASNNGFADTNAVGKVYRRDAIKMYNYIKTKLAVTNNNISVGWNTETTVATIGGTAIKVKIPANPNTDTKNTAGSTDTSSKIFLIGATSQTANPQTYSDDEVFVTSGILTAKTFNSTSLTVSQAVSTDANKNLVSTNLTVSDSTADNGIQYVYKVTQSAVGKIAVTKSTIRSASTSQTGVVQLSSATNSTSETLAATAKAVKTAYDLANTANTTANNHKYWANVESTSAAQYDKEPEVKSVTIGNGSGATTATKKVQMVYDATLECLNFVFAS